MKYVHLVVATTLLATASAPAQTPETSLTFGVSFDHGLNADTAAGNGMAVAHPRVQVIDEEGRGGVIKLEPYQWLCYDIEGNLELDEGTIHLRVRPDIDPAAWKKGGGMGEGLQHLVTANVRTRNELRVYFDFRGEKGEPPTLNFGFKNPELSGNVEIADVSGWKAGEWHDVSVSWQKPNKVSGRVDGGEWVEKRTGAWPQLPEADLYDLYVGGNAVLVDGSPTGSFRTFQGAIDDLTVYDAWQAEPVSAISVDPELTLDLPTPEWSQALPARVVVGLSEAEGDWATRPVEATVTPAHGWSELDAAGRRRAVDALRVVAYDASTGKPRDGLVPFSVSDEAYWADTFNVRFNHEGELPALYAVYYDVDPSDDVETEPATVPMVGVGERLLIGDKETVDVLGLGLRGVFDVGDLDGDGDLDVWYASGYQNVNSRDMLNGHFFLENLGNQGTAAPVLAAPQLIFNGTLPTGVIRSNMTPQLIDINGDDKLDLFYYSVKHTFWIEWSLQKGRPTIERLHDVRIKTDAKNERGRLIDWDGDGKLDLLRGKTIMFAQPEQGGEMFFTDEHSQDLEIGSVADADWKSSPLGLTPVDFDGDGRMELIAGNWVTKLYLHEPTGDGLYDYGPGKLLTTHDDHELQMPGVFPVPIPADWDGDGDLDLLWSTEAGSLGYFENIAGPKAKPKLLQNRFVLCHRPMIDGGALSIPWPVDWDDDGDLDLVLGSSNEYIYYHENLGDEKQAVWGPREELVGSGQRIEYRAGLDGSLLGPQEADWGYINPLVVDFDGDGLKDLIYSGVRGDHWYYRNIGRPGRPQLDGGRLIRVEWGEGGRKTPEWLRFEPQGDELLTAHRSRPAVLDWNGDGVNDYVTLDHESRWAVYLGKRVDNGEVILSPGQHLFEPIGEFSQGLVWNRRDVDADDWRPHYAGRTVTQLIDWDEDGDRDLILDNINARFYENTGTDAKPKFEDRGDLAKARLAMHNSGPTAADMNGDGHLDLVVGTESGLIHYFSRAFLEGGSPRAIVLSDETRTGN